MAVHSFASHPKSPRSSSTFLCCVDSFITLYVVCEGRLAGQDHTSSSSLLSSHELREWSATLSTHHVQEKTINTATSDITNVYSVLHQKIANLCHLSSFCFAKHMNFSKHRVITSMHTYHTMGTHWDVGRRTV